MTGPEFLLLGDAVWLDFVNSARGRDPDPPDLLPDMAAFGRWARHLRLDPGEDRLSVAAVHQLTRVSGAWKLQFAPARPLAALESVARSAAQTLADSLVRVRRCAGATCSLFFLDTTPSGSRRWCCPVACGREAWVERRRGPAR